jgi:hypothetical protein
VSAAGERAALAALFWVESAGDRVREITGGLDPAVRDEAVALLQDREFTRQPREVREHRMVELAGKSAPQEVL